MIYKLQKKFILISASSVFLVIMIIFVLINLLNISSMNNNLDALADRVSMGGGRFPEMSENPDYKGDKPIPDSNLDFMTPETPFSTRYFTVWYDSNGDVVRINIESIYSVTEDMAKEFGKKVIDEKTRGWISNYRYKIYDTESGQAIVFIDGTINRLSLFQTMFISAAVLIVCGLIIILLIIVFSKKVMKPIAESYEKQKRFITDANHELKTPLTLILTNLDIAEAELGQNEWLEDIRYESHRMTNLVNQLVELTRMDEEHEEEAIEELIISDVVLDVVSEFKVLFHEKVKNLQIDIDKDIKFMGNEELIRKLVSILMDNAVKYCDEDGEIIVTVKQRRNIILTIENSYKLVNNIELDRLFDRFYRTDKARTYKGGFGIGLSIAKSIVQKYNGEISAYQKNGTHIGFKLLFK